MKIIIATIKSWNIKRAEHFKQNYNNTDVILITDKDNLNYESVDSIKPDYIFFPHWSWKIPKEIYNNFTCIVFHMTDLPFGRGGSPLQNLISRGINDTKISALQVDGGIDTGDIYIKERLNLNGTAEEILIRASKIIFDDMIPKIIGGDVVLPQEQQGEVIEFKRRTPEQSEILSDFNLDEIYNHIRMLDGEGYPDAFIRFGNYKITFSRASLKEDRIVADVEIMEDVK